MSGLGRELVTALVDALAADDALAGELADALAPHLPAAEHRPAAYTTAALAAELGVSERAIRRACQRGELPATRRCGRWVILPEALEQWAAPDAPKISAPRAAERRRSTPSAGTAAMLATVDR